MLGLLESQRLLTARGPEWTPYSLLGHSCGHGGGKNVKPDRDWRRSQKALLNNILKN